MSLIETRPHSALWLVGLLEPTNQSAYGAVVSITLNIKQTRTNGTDNIIEYNMNSIIIVLNRWRWGS